MKKVNDMKEKVMNVANEGNKQFQKVKKVPIVEEFKEFIARGNVLDLAVGVIIGASFQNLVTSLTNNIISPILGCFTEVDFSQHVLNIGTLHLKYGAFITDIINFIIMAFIVFLIVKFMNKIFLKEEKEESKETEVVKEISNEEKILMEIRDLLKKNQEKK
jgi:large conductance mechanosensitive channel